MSTIIAGRFETFARAETTATRLRARGVRQDDLTMFYVNPPGQHGRYPIGGDEAADPAARKAGAGAGRGIAIGGAVGLGAGVCVLAALRGTLDMQPPSWVLALVLAFSAGVGAYIGSLVGALSRTAQGDVPVRHAGVLLAAHVSADNTALVANELRQNGAQDVERAEGQWRDGRWEDFDPLSSPVPAPVRR